MKTKLLINALLALAIVVTHTAFAQEPEKN